MLQTGNGNSKVYVCELFVVKCVGREWYPFFVLAYKRKIDTRHQCPDKRKLHTQNKEERQTGRDKKIQSLLISEQRQLRPINRYIQKT